MARRDEIEQVVLARVYAISAPDHTLDSTYIQGLRAAVSAAIDYAIASIADGEEQSSVIPSTLLVQARVAARNGVGLDTILRRYFAGYMLLGDFLIDEAQNARHRPEAELKRVLRTQAAVFDHLVRAVSQEYSEERERHLSSARERRVERIRRLLAGDFVDAADLGYEFDRMHLGLIAVGRGSNDAIRRVAESLDRQLLLADLDDETVAIWLGGRRPLDAGRTAEHLLLAWPDIRAVAIGETAEGLSGWRLSHRQAAAALPVARRTARVVRYADAALLASALHDDLLVTSLRQLFIAPLERERNGGQLAFATLRAYFAAERNAASAAATLGITRQAVYSRLRGIEQRLGRSVNSCAAELEVALRAKDLGEPVKSTDLR